MTESQALICYKRLPNWTAQTLPEMVKEKHNTKAGTWAKLTILKGELNFYQLDDDGQVISQTLYSQAEQPLRNHKLGIGLLLHLMIWNVTYLFIANHKT